MVEPEMTVVRFKGGLKIEISTSSPAVKTIPRLMQLRKKPQPSCKMKGEQAPSKS